MDKPVVTGNQLIRRYNNLMLTEGGKPMEVSHRGTGEDAGEYRDGLTCPRMPYRMRL